MENILNAISQLEKLISWFEDVLNDADGCLVAGEDLISAINRLEEIIKTFKQMDGSWEPTLAAIKSGIDGKEKKLLHLMKDVKVRLEQEKDKISRAG